MSLEPGSSLQSCRHLRIIGDKEAYVALVVDPGRNFSELFIKFAKRSQALPRLHIGPRLAYVRRVH
jgi:hypothetical protein